MAEAEQKKLAKERKKKEDRLKDLIGDASGFKITGEAVLEV